MCLLILAALLILISLAWLRKKPAGRRLYPPSPFSLPLIGHLHLLSSGAAPHVLFTQLAQKYGPMVYLRLGSAPVVLASNKDTAKVFLKDCDAVCASRPPSTPGRLLFYGYQDIALAPYGDRWRQLRKLCTLQLFTPRRIESFKCIREEELQLLLASLRESSGEVVNMRAKLMELSFNIICRMLMKKRFYGDVTGKQQEEAKEFLHAMDKAFVLLGQFAIGDFLPWLKWLDIGKVEKGYKEVSKDLGASFERIIKEHEGKGKTAHEEDEDFIDLMIRLRDEGEECLQSRDGIKAVLTNLFGGGTDTSSVTLEWALAELIKSTSTMEKLRQELDMLVGDDKGRFISEKEAEQLPYLRAVVKETFRLHPAIPLLPPHYTMETCEVMGYTVEKGTMVMINAYAISRDPNVWEDPLEFKPERFLGKEVDVRGHDFELVPFGSGRRVCPGLSLALTMVHHALANLVHALEWKTEAGVNINTIDESFGLTVLMANKLQVIPMSR